MWVKRGRTATSADAFFHTTNSDKFWFNFQVDNTLRVYHSGLSVTAIAPNSGTFASTSVWYHLVTTFDGSTVKIFVNAVLVKTQAVTGTLGLASSDGLRVGGKTGQLFQGLIDQTLLYNRALTSAEVAGIYNSGTVPATGLIGRYEFDEGSGTTATDSSGSGNNGTITSATYSSTVATPVPLVKTGNRFLGLIH